MVLFYYALGGAWVDDAEHTTETNVPDDDTQAKRTNQGKDVRPASLVEAPPPGEEKDREIRNHQHSSDV